MFPHHFTIITTVRPLEPGQLGRDRGRLSTWQGRAVPRLSSHRALDAAN